MLEEIKGYLALSPDHYVRTYNTGKRGLMEFSSNDQPCNYRMYHIGEKCAIQKGTNLTRTLADPKEENIISENIISKDEYFEIAKIVLEAVSPK